MGKVVCISDAEQAAQRDEAYLSGRVPPLPPFPGLTGGLIRVDQNSAVGGVGGLLCVHGRVQNDGETIRYDDAIPNGFHVIALDADPDAYLDEPSRTMLARIGAQAIGITHDKALAIPGRVLWDVSGKYEAFFVEHAAKAIIVRPDYYVFGSASSLEELPALVGMLGSGLNLTTDGSCGEKNVRDTINA